MKDLEKENAKFRLDLDRRDFNTSELIYGSVDRTIMDMYEAFKVELTLIMLGGIFLTPDAYF